MCNTNSYEEMLEACKNFNPDDIWVVIMEVYTYDLEENIHIDRWTLGYSKTKEAANGYAGYLKDMMLTNPYRNSGEKAYKFLCDRELIPDEAKKHQDYMYRIQDVDFKAERVRKIGIPETYICDPEKNTECKKTCCQTMCFETTDPRYRKEDN